MLGSLEVIPVRAMNSMYIWLDLAFLVGFVALLVCTKRYQALVAGLVGGLLYFAVDYGVFYSALGTRKVEGADPFWFLLWLSFSYGITNLAWIWLWLDRDRYLKEWSILIVTGWLFVALFSQSLSAHAWAISISRGTGDYHGVMAVLLFVGYGGLCVYNLLQRDREKRAPLLWILAIGLLVQFSWEAVLAVAGIRDRSLDTLIVNSLIETNMGLPFFYLIHRYVTGKRDEEFKPVTGARKQAD
jgi:hypothetical protein